MKKILIPILFLFLTISINAQKSDLVIGEWVFTKALNKDIDEAGIAYIKAEVAGKWKLNFKADGKFDSNMMGEKISGKWKMNSNRNSLVLIGIEGRDQELKILKLTENEMALKLGLGEFLLSKVK